MSTTASHLDLVPAPEHSPQRFKYYDMLVSAFVAVLIVSNIVARKLSNTHIFRAIVSGYTAKVVYEIAMTPLTYLVINFLKCKEGVDVLDVHTRFNPFSI